MVNAHLPRWIRASLTKHFIAALTGTPIFIEGTERDTASAEDFFEFRFDGPLIRETTRKHFVIDVTPNILIQSSMEDSDAYKIHRLIGDAVGKAFTNCIDIRRYGDGPEDDDTLLGKLKLLDAVKTHYLGRIANDLRIEQATVEADYRLYLVEE